MCALGINANDRVEIAYCFFLFRNSEYLNRNFKFGSSIRKIAIFFVLRNFFPRRSRKLKFPFKIVAIHFSSVMKFRRVQTLELKINHRRLKTVKHCYDCTLALQLIEKYYSNSWHWIVNTFQIINKHPKDTTMRHSGETFKPTIWCGKCSSCFTENRHT